MGISFGSIATGLPKDIVQQIMAAEKMPLARMEERKGKVESKNKLVGELKALLSGLRGDILENGNARSLRELKVDTREEIIGVTIDKNKATPGSHQIEVVKLAQKSSALTSAFTDRKDSYVGVGYMKYTLPDGEEKSIYVDQENSSLDGIAKLVNKDTNNGMTATVINDGTEEEAAWRLLISLEDTGDQNKAEFPYFYFVDGDKDFYIEEERPAHDAVIKLDGFEIQLPTNKASDLIPGLTLDLKKAAKGEEFGLQISEDTEAIALKFDSIVENINSVIAFIASQNKIDDKTDTSKTLGGDIILQTIEGRIRAAVFKDVETSVGIRRLGDLGVTFQRDGMLKVDKKVFENAISSNYKASAEILTGYFREDNSKSEGFIDHIGNMLKNSLRFPDGVIPSRERSLKSKIEQFDRRIVQKNRMLDDKEKMLKDKFSRLEGTISKIKSQGAGLAALGAAPAAVTQLG